jgi:hypothetical protein
MVPDPSFITTEQWSQLSTLISTLWFCFALAILISFDLLIGHAVIPSMVASGHLPQGLNRIRPLFYGIAVLAAIGIVVLVASRADLLRVPFDIYEKMWI